MIWKCIRAPGFYGATIAFVLAALALIAIDSFGQDYMADVDDRLRALQILDLLHDGEWRDRSFPFVAMPGVYVSPWSRIVDLPYWLITVAFAPFFGADAAFALAKSVWPLALLFPFAISAMRIIARLRGDIPPPLQMLPVAILMVFAIWEFVPGRIDHHNVQLVTMMVMLLGLVDLRPVRGGLFAGAAATVSIAVGLECVPIIAAGLGTLAIVAAFMLERETVRLRACGAAFALSAPAVAWLSLGEEAVTGAACDAMSGFWITAIALGGAVAITAPTVWRLPLFAGRFAPVRRAAALVVAAAAVAAVLAYGFPACLDGPYGMVDPVSRSFWLDRLDQERTFAVLFENGALGILAIIFIYLLCLGSALPPALRRMRLGDASAIYVFAVAAMSGVLAMLMLRYIKFPSAFVPLLLPFVVQRLSAHTVRRLLIPAAAAPMILAGMASTVFPASYELDVVDLMAGDECRDEDLTVLGEVPPGHIIAPLGLDVVLAETPYGYSVAAVPLHRASPGIRRVMLAFTAHRQSVRRDALQPFDYLAICRSRTGIDLSPAPLFAALNDGIPVAGLIPVNETSHSRFRLYRIDPGAWNAFALPAG